MHRSDMDDYQEQPHGRRAMFRISFKKLMEPLAGFIEERFDVSTFVTRTVLRPPGALPEPEFLSTCYRCGNCVDVCQANAILSSKSDNVDLTGTPYIDPDIAACKMCEERACMKTCPSGALKLVDEILDLRMGYARIEPRLCLRMQGEDCHVCVDRCPVGTAALDIGDGGEIVVHESHCTGCGTCQMSCPAVPKAIVVEPL